MAIAASRQNQSNRPRLLQAVFDAVAQADIRKKLLFTAAMLVVFRFVAHIPIPGVDPNEVQRAVDQSSLLGFFNLFSGGALRQMSVAMLGVYPFITSSIIMQLITPLIPSLQAMQQEGEQGRNRRELYQHWLTVPLCFVQGYAQLVILESQISPVAPNAIFDPSLTGPDALVTVTALFAMTAGTMFLVWIGQLITENGIGNGVSIIIFGGIVAGMPRLVNQVFSADTGLGLVILLAVLAVALIAAIVFMQEAVRRIPVQYARSVFRGGRMYRQSGQSHIPLKVNSAGMIPLIFAFSIVILPAYVAQFIHDSSTTPWVRDVTDFITDFLSPGSGTGGSSTQSPSPGFYILVFLLVVGFSFFYTLVVYQQQNLAENLQKQGGFVPGIRPGRPTSEYIMRVLVRITWAGALFLGFIAILPYLVTSWFDVGALTISATGMLIVVGVVLDTMKQLEAQLLMRSYEGFIR